MCFRERERESKNTSHFVKFIFSFFLFAILFFAVHSSVSAATYYVATTGSDSKTTAEAQNPATPWLTLQHAESAATTGDTIHAAAGTYVENDGTTHGWNSQKGIAWIADGTAIVQGTSPTTRPLYVAGSTTASYTGFTIDSQGLYSYAVNFQTGSANKTFTNCTFENSTFTLVGAGLASNITFTNSTFINSAGYAIQSDNGTGGYHGLTVSGSTFTNGGTYTFWSMGQTDNVTFSGNTINQNNTNYAFFLRAAGTGIYSITGNTIISQGAFLNLYSGSTGSLTFSNNIITITGAIASQVYPFNATVAGAWSPLTISNNNITAQSVSQTQSIIYILNQAVPIISGNTIETFNTATEPIINIGSSGTTGIPQVTNNILKSRSQSGYVIIVGADSSSVGDGKLNGATIQGNTIYGPYYYDPTIVGTVSTHAILYGYQYNGTIQYNKVFGEGYGVVIKGNGTAYTSGGLFYNVFINDVGVSGIRVKGVKNLLIENNTIYSSLYASAPINITINGAGETSTGTVFQNNVVSGIGSALFSIDSSSQTDLNSDYNLWYHQTNGNIGNTGSSYNFSAWQGLGYDTHSVNSDPLFINTGTNDFRLQRTSPAINIGTDLGFTRDFVNTFVPQGALPEAGAYEYIPLTVTINQKSDQIDPTTVSPINYTVVFSESVSDFVTGDVTLTGTAGATTATVTGSGTTYNVAVTGMTGSGTVIATVAADVATGATSNTNAVSTTTDNTVNYDATAPVISVLSSTATLTEATITWITDENSSTKMDYGLTNSYGSSTTETDTGAGITSHSVAISGLSNCTIYHYRVRSKDALLNEGLSSDNTFKTLGCSSTPPSCTSTTPTGTSPWLYSAVSNSSSSVTLNFTNHQTPITHFTLEYGTESGKYIYGADNISKDTTTYTVNSLAPNTTYFFRIRSGNGCAVGSWSNEMSVKTKSNFTVNDLNIIDSEIITTPVDPKPKTTKDTKSEEFKGYKVNIKVLDTNKKPVLGAKVTLHSTPKEATTDENGIAHFTNVEKGDHKVLIAYENFTGEQSINLTGDVKEFNINVTVDEKRFSISPFAWWIIGGMGLIIAFLIIKSKLKKT